MNIGERIFGNLKTTIGGSAVGVALLGVGAMIIQQAHCDFSQVQWIGILTALFMGPATVGALATDNGKAA